MEGRIFESARETVGFVLLIGQKIGIVSASAKLKPLAFTQIRSPDLKDVLPPGP